MLQLLVAVLVLFVSVSFLKAIYFIFRPFWQSKILKVALCVTCGYVVSVYSDDMLIIVADVYMGYMWSIFYERLHSDFNI